MGHKLPSYSGSFESMKELKEWQVCFLEKKSFNWSTQFKVQVIR